MKENWVSASTACGLLGTLGSIEEKLLIHSTLRYKYFCQFQFQTRKRLSVGLGIGPQRWLSEPELALALTCCQHILLEEDTHALTPQMQGMQAERKDRSIPIEKTATKHIPFSKRESVIGSNYSQCLVPCHHHHYSVTLSPPILSLPKYHRHVHVLLRIYPKHYSSAMILSEQLSRTIP